VRDLGSFWRHSRPRSSLPKWASMKSQTSVSAGQRGARPAECRGRTPINRLITKDCKHQVPDLGQRTPASKSCPGLEAYSNKSGCTI